jgi:hypothetical protein
MNIIQVAFASINPTKFLKRRRVSTLHEAGALGSGFGFSREWGFMRSGVGG